MNMDTKITVVSLGPGDPSLLTLQAAELLRDPHVRVIFRTARHPVTAWLEAQGIHPENLDAFYDQYEDFDKMHRAQAAWLWQEAQKKPIVLGVMDPSSDGLVASLRAGLPKKGKLSILPGVNPANGCLAALPEAVSAENGIQFFSATDFLTRPWNPSVHLLITELDSSLLAGEVKLKLGDLLPDEQEILFFPPSEAADRPVKRIPLYLLDSQKEYNHTTALFVPGIEALQRDRHTFEDLWQIVSRLRAPDGCPWDRVQTHASLTPYMVEEAWEAVNAIEDQDMDHLADELGDVLFQVFIHASIGESFDEFSLTDVVSGICHKMIQRHPHVFGASHGETAEEISQGWEARKRAETGSKTVGDTLNDVSQSLPALKYAIKMNKKFCQLPALRRDPQEIEADIQSLAKELAPDGKMSPEKMGQLLMKCTELCYRADQDAEILLHQEVERCKKTYQAAEKAVYADKKSPESLTFQQLRVYLCSVEGE